MSILRLRRRFRGTWGGEIWRRFGRDLGRTSGGDMEEKVEKVEKVEKKKGRNNAG